MRYLSIFLLLLGAVAGLTLQPTQALAGPMGVMPMSTVHGRGMAAMRNCMAVTPKDKAPPPCECGIAGCLAMMASDVPIMRVDGLVSLKEWTSSSAVEHHFVSTVLSGRTTTPEPEPPSALI